MSHQCLTQESTECRPHAHLKESYLMTTTFPVDHCNDEAVMIVLVGPIC